MRWTEAQLASFQARRAVAPIASPAPRGSETGSAARATANSDRRRAPRNVRLPAPLEAVDHEAVVAHLRIRCRAGIHWHHSPAGELRDPAVAAKLQRMGTKPGVPDLLFVIEGRLHGLELKRERGGRLSPEQITMHAELRAAGAIVETARGLDQALAILAAWGVLPTSTDNPKGAA